MITSPTTPRHPRPSLRLPSAAAVACACLASLAHAQSTPEEPPAPDTGPLQLDDLLQMRIDTATIREKSWISQPATLTVMRSRDIDAIGARYLQEVLDFVPGMSHGVDVFGVNSLIVRGHWAQEGKVLLMLDDMPLNDLLYGSLSLARRYPTEQLDRVEILRGAGMAKYGGNAQLAVIRMQSVAPAQSGITVGAGTDYLENAGFGWQTTGTAAYVKDDLAITLSGHYAELPYSGEDWLDNAGRTWDLGDTTSLYTANALTKVDWNNLHFRFFYDRHLGESPQRFGFGVPGEEVMFESFNTSLHYDIQASESITVTPKVSYRYQEDWFIKRDPNLTPTVNFFLPAQELRASLEAKASLGDFDFLGGGEYRYEYASCDSPGGPPGVNDADTYFQGGEDIDFEGAAAYLQTDWTHGPWLATAGARYSHHSYAGNSLVPRASVSYAQDHWHLKGVAGQAFREPDIEAINSADPARGPIEPEITTQFEVEFGWKPTSRILGTIALFEMRIEDPIIYASTTTDYYYFNNDTVITRGVELDWRLDLSPLSLITGYSFYTAEPIDPYAVPQDESALIGAPHHKVYLSADLELPIPAWHLLGSLVWYSSLYAADFDPAASDINGNSLSIQQQPERFLVNLAARYQKNSWSFTLGVKDLVGDGRLLAQPYYSESTPYHAGGREVWFTVSKSFR